MLRASIPAKFPQRFAAAAGGGFIRPIPNASQIGTEDGAASLTGDGFPPLCFMPVGSGGVPPFGQDMNGILNQSTAWDQWVQAGGPVPYDATFSAAINGYPQGAVVASAVTFGLYWFCLVDDNTSNPDTGGANWVPFSYTGGFSTGDVKLTYKTVADFGFIMLADQTIGSASSGAGYANALAFDLFVLLYNNIVDAWAPILTSGGGATTRGAQGTAATAWGSNCRLTLSKTLGLAFAVAGSGAGLTARALGQFMKPSTSPIGEESHALTSGEAPPLATFSGYLSGGGLGAVTSYSGASGAAHNNMQPTSFINAMVKL